MFVQFPEFELYQLYTMDLKTKKFVVVKCGYTPSLNSDKEYLDKWLSDTKCRCEDCDKLRNKLISS